MWELFNDLCVKNGVSVRQVALAIGVAPSTLGDIKRGARPRDTTLKKLADYFGVSVEYLITGTKKEDTPSEEDALDEQLIAMLKKLDPAQTQRVLDFVQGMLST